MPYLNFLRIKNGINQICKTSKIQEHVKNANSAFILIILLISRGCQIGLIGQGGPGGPGGQGGQGGPVVRWSGGQVVRAVKVFMMARVVQMVLWFLWSR